MKRILFFLGLSATFPALSQESDTTELLPVEVKAIRAGAMAPFAKTNLSKREIQKQNLGQDLPFLLNQTPSVVVNSDAGNGIGYTGIRIRGTDATRINVTINGVPFNDPESNGAFFVNLPDLLSSVNSIQIQRGVGTSSNGAGAFGGTINLSTTEVAKQPYFESNNSVGSFNTIKNNIRVGSGLLGNHFTTDLRLSQMKSDGYIERASTALRSYFFSAAYLADKTTLRFNTFSGNEKTYQAWNGVSEADLKTRRRYNSAGTERPGEPYDNETDNYKQDHYQLFFTQNFSPELVFNTGLFYIKGKGYYEQYKGGEDYADYGLPGRTYGSTVIESTDLIRRLWLDNDYYGSIFSLQYAQPGTELSFGGALSRYLGDHFGNIIWAQNGLPQDNYKWYDNNAIKNDASVYAKWQQNLSPLFRFFADLQVRHVDYNIDGFRNNPGLTVDQQYTFFNPKAGITFHNQNWTAFASYSFGSKEPVRDDFEASVNEQPKPEYLRDLEVGFERKNSIYNIGATVYYMKYKDQLVLTGKINDVGAYTRTNIDDSYRLGLELQGGVVVTNWMRAAANLTLSRNKVKNFTEFYDDYDNGGQKSILYKETDISFSPSVTGAATITLQPFRSFSVDLLSKYVGKQYLDNTSNNNRVLNAYFTEDIRFAYSLQKGVLKNADVIVQVNNIFTKKYEPNGYTFSYLYNSELITENYYYPMAGTNWMLGLNLRF
ncbi:MAG TPA: TonB-dependent receptor plug domain-containing protein [Flavisolibacter sp.]|nr:TonB-dependent receptor plug domain-containing protein [Flavisolibacter sp.]